MGQCRVVMMDYQQLLREYAHRHGQFLQVTLTAGFGCLVCGFPVCLAVFYLSVLLNIKELGC